MGLAGKSSLLDLVLCSVSGFLPYDDQPELHLRPVLRYRISIMTEKPSPDAETTQRKAEVERQATKRAERSAEQLRANLQRRKAQTRARRTGGADERPDGLATSDNKPSGDS